MERLIDKVEENIQNDHRYQIHVGNKKFDFNCEDELFKLNEPIGIEKNGYKCNTCDIKIARNNKRKYCDFCGFLNCPKCMYKKRDFNQGTQNILLEIDNNYNEIDFSPGNICKICDRKFMIYKTF